MKWKKFKIETVTDAEDIIVSALYDMGLEGAQIEDKVPLSAWEKEQMFVDILPDEQEDDGIAYLSFFVEETEKGKLLWRGKETETDVVLTMVTKELEKIKRWMDIGKGSVTLEETEDIDWINNWKQYFHQFTIDELLVVPSWEEIREEDKEKKILHIDPGTAFGTGMHETTQLCIRQLKKFITPQTRLLDVGTGSGILSIVSLLYGIKEAVGTDLDPCAVEAVRDNMEANHIGENKFRLIIGNLITEKEVRDKINYGCYDIAVANILTEVLVPLTPVIASCLKEGGIYITSGIIEGRETDVIRAMEQAGFEIVELNSQGEWRSVTARKK